MKPSKRSVILFTSVLVVVLATLFVLYKNSQPKTWADVLGRPEYSKVNMNKPLREQTRTVRIAGRTFRIPLMYISGPLDNGIDQNGVNLKYVLPDYSSILEH
jgi:hypothetical protein